MVRGEHLDRRAKAKVQYDKAACKELALLVPGQFFLTKPNYHHRVERWNYGEVTHVRMSLEHKTDWPDVTKPS